MKIIMKCKPVFNFQSVEFDFELNYDEEQYNNSIEEMFSLYNDILAHLQELAPEQPVGKPVQKKVIGKAEELASDGQKKYLDSLGIPYNENLTKKQAVLMIKNALGDK